MRLALLFALPLVACTPDVVTGSYACGPDESCPEGQACNLADNKCVLPGLVEPFACVPELDSEPDDTPDTGAGLTLVCDVGLAIDGCMLEGDSSDWYEVMLPTSCSAFALDARVTFPYAFEELQLELVDLDANATVATSGDCATSDDFATTERCLIATLTAEGHYGLHVTPTGEGDCDGDCAFTRYTIHVQVGTP